MPPHSSSGGIQKNGVNNIFSYHFGISGLLETGILPNGLFGAILYIFMLLSNLIQGHISILLALKVLIVNVTLY